MAKGLPWIRLSTSIAMDGDLEFVSDAAFRTYVELIALAGHYLTDGRVPLRIVKKQCNTADVEAALEELQEAGFVEMEDEEAFVPTYAKWQETAEKVQARRGKTAERVRRYRDSDSDADSNADSNAVTNAPQSKSKSKSKNKIKDVCGGEPVENPQQAALSILRETPGYPFDEGKDAQRLSELATDFPAVDLLREISKWRDWLADRKDNGKRKFNYRLSLRNWIEQAEKIRARDHPPPVAAVPEFNPGFEPVDREEAAAQAAQAAAEIRRIAEAISL